MAVPEGFEPSTLGVEIPCSIQLNYGTIISIIPVIKEKASLFCFEGRLAEPRKIKPLGHILHMHCCRLHLRFRLWSPRSLNVDNRAYTPPS